MRIVCVFAGVCFLSTIVRGNIELALLGAVMLIIGLFVPEFKDEK